MFARIGQNVIKVEKSKRVKNFLIDYYLDGFKKRREGRENKLIVLINYFTIISYFVCIFKYSLSFVFKLKYETKLLLFDISLFFGGIEKYNKIILICISIMGMGMNYKLRLSASQEIQEWTQLFELTRSRVRSLFLVNGSENAILSKVIKSVKIVYPFITFLYITTSKCSLFNFYLGVLINLHNFSDINQLGVFDDEHEIFHIQSIFEVVFLSIYKCCRLLCLFYRCISCWNYCFDSLLLSTHEN